VGYYIEVPEPINKASQLVVLHEAVAIPPPRSFDAIPSDQALICVVENGMFDAAGVCYDEKEFSAFNHPDGRRKFWLLMNKEEAIRLCPRLASVHGPWYAGARYE